VAEEVVQLVKVLDGLNHHRFRKEPELLAAWKSASNVMNVVRGPETQPAPVATLSPGGEAKPAA
jgi:hypothetical protein